MPAKLPASKYYTKNINGLVIGPYAFLQDANLAGADLSRANLINAVLVSADLSGANLEGADLRRADLTNANLVGADLSGANIEGANFTNANLTGAILKKTIVSSVNFSGANLENAKLSAFRASKSRFRDAILTGVNLKNVSFGKADFTNANLERAVLDHTDFFSCNLKNLKAKDSVIVNGVLFRSDLRGADLSGTTFKNINFLQSKLDKIDFRNCVLIHPKFFQSSLKKANLSGMNLTIATFNKAKMQGANLSGANLTDANFEEANLTSVNFTNAIFKNTDLTRAVLTGAKLAGTNPKGAIITLPPIAAKSYGFMTGPILKMSKPDSPTRAPDFKKIYPAEFERLKADMGGRDFNENIKKSIRDKYLTPFNWVITRQLWKNPTQRLSKKPNSVMILNIDTESGDFTEHQAELLKGLSKAVYLDSTHPHERARLLTVGWIRYAKDLKRKVILIEEVQSDLNSTSLKRTASSAYSLRLGSIDQEQFWEAAGLIQAYVERFYEDAIGLIYEEAAALGYTVEMLGYEDKLQYCYEDDFGVERCPPKTVYTDLPKRMGMTQKRDSEVPVRNKLLGKVSYYKPNPGIPPRYRQECCICGQPAALMSEIGEVFCEDCF